MHNSGPTETDLPEPDPADLLPARSFGYRLWMLRHAWTRRMEAAVANTGLTHMQFFVLRATEHFTNSGALPAQTRIAEGLHIDRMTVSKVVRTLEAKCLLTRVTHPDDPRAKGVALTAEGMEVLGRAIRLVHAEQQRFFGRLGPAGQAAFSDMLDRLLLLEGVDPSVSAFALPPITVQPTPPKRPKTMPTKEMA